MAAMHLCAARAARLVPSVPPRVGARVLTWGAASRAAPLPPTLRRTLASDSGFRHGGVDRLHGETTVGVVEGNKTTVRFTTYNKPGALEGALRLFQKHDINMTRIESQPRKTE